ncbi:hypothetical protein [Gimesia chilikensis]|uniref:hypothetical protein n=1 Tax=Gimesia chilikensis TaxID=2605989 RepID=UPI003A939C5F
MRIFLLIAILFAGCSGESTNTSEPHDIPLRLDLAGTGLSDTVKECIIASKGDEHEAFDFNDRYKCRYKYKVVCEGVTYIVDIDASGGIIYGITKNETPTDSEDDNSEDPPIR